jgi:hypothetical protein
MCLVNLALGPVPVRCASLNFCTFPVAVRGELFEEFDPLGALVSRKLSSAMRDQVFRGSGCPSVQPRTPVTISPHLRSGIPMTNVDRVRRMLVFAGIGD